MEQGLCVTFEIHTTLAGRLARSMLQATHPGNRSMTVGQVRNADQDLWAQ